MPYLERVGFGIESDRVHSWKITCPNAGCWNLAVALRLQSLLQHKSRSRRRIFLEFVMGFFDEWIIRRQERSKQLGCSRDQPEHEVYTQAEVRSVDKPRTCPIHDLLCLFN